MKPHAPGGRLTASQMSRRYWSHHQRIRSASAWTGRHDPVASEIGASGRYQPTTAGLLAALTRALHPARTGVGGGKRVHRRLGRGDGEWSRLPGAGNATRATRATCAIAGGARNRGGQTSPPAGTSQEAGLVAEPVPPALDWTLTLLPARCHIDDSWLLLVPELLQK